LWPGCDDALGRSTGGTNLEAEIHSGRSLFRGAIWSILGHVLPLAVAVVAIPRLLHRLGDDRFGLLTLFWVLAGYFNILDLGLGRALILAFSRLRPGVDSDRITSTFWVGGAILAAIGLALSAVIQLFAAPLTDLLGVAPSLRTEAVGAMRIVGWTMPTTLVLPVLMALPTAFQKQKGLTFLRIPAGVASHLIPLVMVSWTHDLRQLLLANLGLRVVLLVAHFLFATHVHPVSWPPRALRATAAALLASSSWMMLTNVLAPLLMNIDRLLISHVSGTGALSSYAPAMDLALKSMVLAGVSLAVVFPALGWHITHDPVEARAFYSSTLRSLSWWSPPFLLLATGAARPVLTLWLGTSHGVLAGTILAILLVGVLAGLPGQISFAAVQASGDARKASFVHLIEVPIYGLLLWGGIRWGGVISIAWIWASRHVFDSTAMHILARRKGLRVDSEAAILAPMSAGLAIAIATALLQGVSNWAGCALGTGACLAWIALGLSTKGGRDALPPFARVFLDRLGRVVPR